MSTNVRAPRLQAHPEPGIDAGEEPALPPSRPLLRAAISGLLAAGVSACKDDEPQHHEELSDEELEHLCEPMVSDAVDQARDDLNLEEECADMVQAATEACPMPDLETECADMVQAAADECLPFTATPDEKTTNSEQVEHTFAELTAMCDDQGGYTQVHAACGGHNACAGFSYGDWGPGGATLTEHSCAGVNGCNGLSCVVPTAAGSNRTGAEIYEAEYEEPGPGACINCHAEWDADGNADATKFKVWVLAGSTRTVDNWLDRTVAEQERVVAFGVHSVLPDGTAYQGMAPYHRVLTRPEIERVVAHLRTLEPVIAEIKTQDP
jgi:hypothetical protein